MNRKAVFFDADGTVSNLIKGVPASAEAAIHALQDKGHLAFLCTGRSRALVDEPLERIGFDGIIAAAGAYLEKDGIVLYNQELSCKDARTVLDILRHAGLVPVMEGKDYMYYDPEEYTKDVDRISPGSLAVNTARSAEMKTECLSIRSVPRQCRAVM